VRPSAGSLQNLERLEKDEAQVGFVQGGVVEPRAIPKKMRIPPCFRWAVSSMSRSGSSTAPMAALTAATVSTA
jgi:hypothetical protein